MVLFSIAASGPRNPSRILSVANPLMQASLGHVYLIDMPPAKLPHVMAVLADPDRMLGAATGPVTRSPATSRTEPRIWLEVLFPVGGVGVGLLPADAAPSPPRFLCRGLVWAPRLAQRPGSPNRGAHGGLGTAAPLASFGRKVAFGHGKAVIKTKAAAPDWVH